MRHTRVMCSQTTRKLAGIPCVCACQEWSRNKYTVQGDGRQGSKESKGKVSSADQRPGWEACVNLSVKKKKKKKKKTENNHKSRGGAMKAGGT